MYGKGVEQKSAAFGVCVKMLKSLQHAPNIAIPTATTNKNGTNENTNGLFRLFKGDDSRQVADDELRGGIKQPDNHPRSRFGYQAPGWVFLGEYSGALDTAVMA